MRGWSEGLIHAVRSASDTQVPARVEAWTDQHPAVLDRLRSTGRYHADGRRVPKSLRPALWWLRNEMRSRVPGATGRPPIWSMVVPMVTRVDVCDWSCTRYGNLCSKLHITPGKDWLQLSVPANRTLVSDFDLWNRFVVQYRYVPENDDDADRWDRRVRRVLKVGRAEPTPTVSAGWPESLVRATIASWSRVFDVAPGRPAQCAVEALYHDDVIEVLPAPLIADVRVEYRVNTSTYIVQPKGRRR